MKTFLEETEDRRAQLSDLSASEKILSPTSVLCLQLKFATKFFVFV
jgi:hypothetical protein